MTDITNKNMKQLALGIALSVGSIANLVLLLIFWKGFDWQNVLWGISSAGFLWIGIDTILSSKKSNKIRN